MEESDQGLVYWTVLEVKLKTSWVWRWSAKCSLV